MARTMPVRPPSEDPYVLFVLRRGSLAEVAEVLRGKPGCSLSRIRARSAQEKWVLDRWALIELVQERVAERLGVPHVPTPTPRQLPSLRMRTRALAKYTRRMERARASMNRS